MTTKPNPDWISLAVVTQPHGVSGRLKVKSFSQPEDGFAKYKTLTDAAGNPVKLKITGQAQGQYIIAIEGVNDRNEADRWRGRELGIKRSALPPLKRDAAFYIAELEGMAVVDSDGAIVGVVASVANFGAGDLLEIADLTGHSEYYSFTDSNFPAVDRGARRITFTPPEYLGSRAEEEGQA